MVRGKEKEEVVLVSGLGLETVPKGMEKEMILRAKESE